MTSVKKSMLVFAVGIFHFFAMSNIFAGASFFQVPNSESKVFYTIGQDWKITDYGSQSNKLRKLLVRSASKKYNLDDVPSILFQIESANRTDVISPVHYHVFSMAHLPKIIINKRIFSFSDHLVNIKSVIGEYGTVTVGGKKMIMSNVTFTVGNKGAKIIFTCPPKYFDSIQAEFFSFLASIKIDSKELVPEVQEMQDADGTAVYLRYKDLGLVKRQLSAHVRNIPVTDSPDTFYRYKSPNSN